MNINWVTVLRNTVLALTFAISFSPFAANAYTSSGNDGIFHPTDSIVLDLTQQIFNFTSIYIPNGVMVSFNGLAFSQPIQFLATGDIYIAGILDAGANSLWMETPGSISVSGSLTTAGGSLSLVANTIDLSGAVTTAGGGTTGSGGGDLTITGRDLIKGGDATIIAGGDITLTGGGNISLGGGGGRGGGGTITTGGGEITLSGGGALTITDEGSCSGTCSIQLAVPEPDVWVMFLIGLCGLFAVSRLRNPNLRPA